MESEFCWPGFQQAHTRVKCGQESSSLEAALVVLCGKQSCERLLFQDVQALGMLASNQYSGHGSCCKVPQSTGYLKGRNRADQEEA